MTKGFNFRMTVEEIDVLEWLKAAKSQLSESDLIRTILLGEAKRLGISSALLAAAIQSRAEHAPRARRIPFYKGFPHRR